MHNLRSINCKFSIKLLLTICIFICNIVFAQNTITLSQAVQYALQNSLELQIAQNETQIAHNNNHDGNAGMMPNISIGASENPGITNINQKFTNGTEINRNNVFSHSLNVNLLATYTLFDGKKYAIKKRLELLDIAANNQLKDKMQQIINNVIVGYSNIVRQQKYLEVLNQLEDLSKQRFEIIKTRKEAGLANNTDLFLAQLENDTRQQNVLSQKVLIQTAYYNLNTILNFKTDSTYNVEEFTLSPQALQKNNLDSLLKQNIQLLLAENNLQIANQTEREISAARLPNLKLSGAYNYNLAQSQAGFSLLNQNYGPQAGINLSIPLFTGKVNQRNYANAQINTKTAEIQKQITQQNIQNSYLQAWENYSIANQQIATDKESIKTAQQYIDLMQMRFKAGENTIIELKEAQRTYEETLYRQINNQYIAKLAETQLMYLVNGLVK